MPGNAAEAGDAMALVVAKFDEGPDDFFAQGVPAVLRREVEGFLEDHGRQEGDEGAQKRALLNQSGAEVLEG